MSDSLRERKGQCERCHQWREGVSEATDWTCSECRLRERCDELERSLTEANEQIDGLLGIAHERDAALCRASEAAQECGRLEARLEHATALVRECREWLIAGGPSSVTRFRYIEFHQRLDAACGDGSTLWYDQRPKEARD